MNFITREEYQKAMEELNEFQLPNGYIQDYVMKKYPETKNDAKLYQQKYYLVLNVKRGRSFETGLREGIVEDFYKLLQKLKKQ